MTNKQQQVRDAIDLTIKGVHALMEAGVSRNVWESICNALDNAEEEMEEFINNEEGK